MVNQKIKIIYTAGIFAGFVILVFASMYALNSHDASITQIQVGNINLDVDIADTFLLRKQGLSNRETLPKDTGMLFVFDDAKIRNFWMKDMNFDLDVLWIHDGKVVGMQESISHKLLDNGDIVRFKSNVPSNMVLEVNSGWISAHNVYIDDRLNY